VAVSAPEPLSTNPLRTLVHEVQAERHAEVPYPPGETRFSVARTRRFERDPVPLLLEAYRDHGPVFTLRLLWAPVVFMLGPEANHYMTVSHAQNFRWRDGSLGDLIPLLGDGLLTTDGEYHRHARRIMLPAFHRERIAEAADAMIEEALSGLGPWRAGDRVDLYAWTRHVALRVAMRALFGFDPDRAADGFDPAQEFERALAFHGYDYTLQMLRGPGTPWARLRSARTKLDRVIFAEIARRRADPGHGGGDIMSLLLEARDEDGEGLSDRQLRDQVMTLMFAGHDTTTSTVTFLFHELARGPHVRERLLAEQDRVLGGRVPTAAELTNDLEAVRRAFATLTAERGTAFYDAVVAAVSYLQGVAGHSAILLYSDGRDRSSRFTFAQSLEFAQRAGVTIYSIGADLPAFDVVARRQLCKLSEETGGRCFFVRTENLAEAYTTIERDLRHRYLLTYEPGPSSNRGFHAIEVRVSNGRRARSLAGYYP